MLSIFPDLLFLSPFAALLIRVTAAIAFGYTGRIHITQRGPLLVFGIFEAAAAMMLLIGLYTQAAALLGIVIFVVHAFKPSFRALPMSAVLLLIVMCLSLLVTGPGPFSFDFPL